MASVTTLELGLVHNGQRQNLATWLEKLKSSSDSGKLKEELMKELESDCTTVSLCVYDSSIIKEPSGGFGTFELLLHQLVGVYRKLLRSEVSFLRGTSDDAENAFFVFEPRPPRDIVRISKFCFCETVSYAIKEEDGLVSRFLEKYVEDSRKMFSMIELPQKSNVVTVSPKLMELPLTTLTTQIREQVSIGYELMKLVYGDAKPLYCSPPFIALDDIWG